MQEPENLQDRMIKMEAELTALREELSTRATAASPAKLAQKPTSATNGEEDNNADAPTSASVIIKNE